MAAVVAEESPLFINAAREPDVVDLHDVEPDGRTGRRCVTHDHHRCPRGCPTDTAIGIVSLPPLRGIAAVQ